jgi:hypothetical protein
MKSYVREELDRLESRARIADYCGAIVFAILLALTAVLLMV